MCLKNDNFEFVGTENELIWEFHNNAQLAKRIREIIQKYTEKQEVIDLFKKINEDPKE